MLGPGVSSSSRTVRMNSGTLHQLCREQVNAPTPFPFDPSQRLGAAAPSCWASFSCIRERAMAARTKTYPIVENAINLFADWLKHRQEMRELRDMNSGEFGRIAQDLCVSPGELEAGLRQGTASRTIPRQWCTYGPG